MDNDKKQCIKCLQVKFLSAFKIDKRTNRHKNVCIDCEKEYYRQYAEKHKEHKKEVYKKWYEDNKENVLRYQKEYRSLHKDKISERDKKYREENADELRIKKAEYYKKNKEYFQNKHKEYYEKNADKLKEYQRTYREENTEKIFARRKTYRENNAEFIKARKKEYAKNNREKITSYWLNKRQSDPLFKLSTQIRSLILVSIKNKGYEKDSSTQKILGCDYETLWEHLKDTWVKNYGSEWNGEPYHIDHIIPLASAKDEDELIRLCHYSNLQLLKPVDNLKKGKKMDWSKTTNN